MTFADFVALVARAPAHLPHVVVGVGDLGFVIRVHVLQPLDPLGQRELYEWLRDRTPMTLGLEVTCACCSKALECGGLCRLKPRHEGSCLCVGDVDGVGTCPA